MTSVNGESPARADHIASLLGRAIGMIRAEMLATSEQHFPGLRVSHYRLLELIPDGGARITDLAEVAAMTKQGLGQHIDYLEKLGFVESDRLPTDRRVRLVRRTALGDEAVAFERTVIGEVEASWAQRLGPDRLEALRGILAELTG